MSFVTGKFFLFLSILFIVYFLAHKLCKKQQWIVLLIASYIFYSISSLKYLAFLLVSTLVTWLTAIMIDRCNFTMQKEFDEKGEDLDKENKQLIKKKWDRKKKILITIGIVISIGILFVVKYTNFIIGSLNNVFGLNMSRLNWLVLPLGLSFYTFQSLGYSIDVYRGIVPAEKNIFKYALYVSYFPSVCEGPIANYPELSEQLYTPHAFNYDRFMKGLIRVLIGLFKKLLIADILAQFINPVYENYMMYSGVILLFATILYSIQLYADFSGYIDIALGVSECLGIKLTENFDTPYFSKSISEYWRRWHISLGAWFRNYIYYPVLRSSIANKINKSFIKKKKRKIGGNIIATMGLLTTWTFIGMWHGTGLNFLVHGWYHCFFIVTSLWLDDFYKKTKTKLHIKENAFYRAFQIVRTYTIVLFGYVLFRADGLVAAMEILRRIFTEFNFSGASAALAIFTETQWSLIFIGIFVLIGIDLIEQSKKLHELIYSCPRWIRWPVVYVMLIPVVIYLFTITSGGGSFLYFNF